MRKEDKERMEGEEGVERDEVKERRRSWLMMAMMELCIF